MIKVIVTGANGFIGRNLIKLLSDYGMFVYAIIKDNDIKEKFVNKNIKYITLDMDSVHMLDKVLSDKDIDIFYHLAWSGSSGLLRGDHNVQINNIRYSVDAINVAKRMGCKKFIFAESIMQYEICKAIESNSIVSVNNIYSIAKLSAKFMLYTIAQSIGINYIGALISNIYGPGEFSSRLVNDTVRKLLNNEKCQFSSGEQLYDFIYIDDAVEILKIIGINNNKHNQYYIGNVKQKKLKYFLTSLKDIVSPNAILGFGELPNPSTIINFDEFDTKSFFDEYNYELKYTFEEGILKTMESIKNE